MRKHHARGQLTATLIVAMIGLAACGSSSKPKPKTSTAVAATQTATSGPTTTTTTTPARNPAHKRPHPKAAAPAKSPSPAPATSQATTAPNNGTAVADPSAVTPGPVAMACLSQAGLHHVRKAHEPGVDVGNTGNTSATDVNGMVFVDGPYKSVSKADNSAQSLLGVEYAARGGLYVVSATLRSQLNGTVHKVAACLSSKSAPSGKAAGNKYTF